MAMGNRIGDPALASRLKRALRGEVLFDPFSRGRYSTDASIYQIEPIGVTLPRDVEDVEAAIAIAREEGVPVLPRGGGSSQSGQTVNEAVVMDTSRHMNRLLEVDVERGTATVQPGIVLDRLNKELKPTGWYFPIDVSTSQRRDDRRHDRQQLRRRPVHQVRDHGSQRPRDRDRAGRRIADPSRRDGGKRRLVPRRRAGGRDARPLSQSTPPRLRCGIQR